MTTENATRFAQHVAFKCERATEVDRSIAIDHAALTGKRREKRVARQTQAERIQSTIAAVVVDESSVSVSTSIIADDSNNDGLYRHQVDGELSEIASEDDFLLRGGSYCDFDLFPVSMYYQKLRRRFRLIQPRTVS